MAPKRATTEDIMMEDAGDSKSSLLQELEDGYLYVKVTGIPFVGVKAFYVPRGATLDILKQKVGQIELHDGPQPYQEGPLSALIPTGQWGFHSPQRAVPYNMPVSALRENDLPLRFSWHEWSASWQEHGAGEYWDEMRWQRD